MLRGIFVFLRIQGQPVRTTCHTIAQMYQSRNPFHPEKEVGNMSQKYDDSNLVIGSIFAGMACGVGGGIVSDHVFGTPMMTGVVVGIIFAFIAGFLIFGLLTWALEWLDSD